MMNLRTAEKLYERTLLERVEWLISLRWIAVAGLAGTAITVDRIFPITLPPISKVGLLGFAGFLGLYNLLLYLRLRYIFKEAKRDPSLMIKCPYRLTHIQIIVDLVCLAIILNLAGGLINPLCLFMIFHIAIAGIILPRMQVFRVASFASCLLLIMGVVGKVYPHIRVPLEGFPLEIDPPLTENWFFIISSWLSYTITFFLIAYFTANISSQLRDALIKLEEVNESLQEQDKVKSNLLRIVAHQLKSPLATMTTMVKAFLTTQEEETLDPHIYELLNKILTRSNAMLELVDDLLRLTQIKEGLDKHEEIKDIKVADVILETAQMFAEQAQEKGIDFELVVDDTETVIRARERDIPDIVSNLVSNAIKYTDSGKILVEGKRKQNNYVIRVSDTGIGIPQEDQKHLFEEFYRAGNAQKKALHSSGLGLSIVNAIVKRLGGEITFKSEEGEGTTFEVRIPIAK